MITYMYTRPVAGNLPIKTLVARRLQTHTHRLYPRWLELSSTEIYIQCIYVKIITVTLEWKGEAGVTYTANIFPATDAPLIFVESARLQLNLSYNIVYNVSITATLCRQNSVNTALKLSYSESH